MSKPLSILLCLLCATVPLADGANSVTTLQVTNYHYAGRRLFIADNGDPLVGDDGVRLATD